jgi:hypothetical protein
VEVFEGSAVLLAVADAVAVSDGAGGVVDNAVTVATGDPDAVLAWKPGIVALVSGGSEGSVTRIAEAMAAPG